MLVRVLLLDTRHMEDMDISPEVTPPVMNSQHGHHNLLPTTSTNSNHYSQHNVSHKQQSSGLYLVYNMWCSYRSS